MKTSTGHTPPRPGRPRLRAALFLLLFPALLAPLTARGIGTDADWSDRFASPAMGPVNALVEFDGRLIAGGDFTSIASVPFNRVAAWDGAAWSALGAGFDNSVTALAVFNGELIAAGWFTHSGATAVNRIARWDGADWQPLGAGTDAGIDALVIQGDSLFAAGAFTSAGGVPANGVARWHAGAWSALGSGVQFGEALSLAVYDGMLHVGGTFTTAGDQPAEYIARWNGASWGPVQGSLFNKVGGYVHALAVHQGSLVAGGFFFQGSFNNIARWNGTSWSSLGTGLDDQFETGRVYALAVRNGVLCAGGTFNDASGVPAKYVAAWNGSAWGALGEGLSLPPVRALAAFGTKLYAGHHAGGADIGLSAWDDARWASVGDWSLVTHGLDGAVLASVVWNNSLVVGGTFTKAATPLGWIPVSGIAQWDGNAWGPLGAGVGGAVYALAVHEGELLAGGSFSQAGGVPASSVARWNGSAWHPLGTGVSGSGSAYVQALAVFGGELVAGGGFEQAGGVTVNHIARWNGSTWSALGTGVSGNLGPGLARVEALAVHGGALIAGGYFVQAGGVTVNGVARWDGAGWSALGAGMNNGVNALTVHGTDLVAGGRFTLAGGLGANRVAAWDGLTWSALGAGVSGNIGLGAAPVEAFGSYAGDLVAGGAFSQAGSAPASGVARWDGVAWAPFGSGTSFTVRALAAFQGRLFAGGEFTVAGGKPSFHLGQWTDPGALDVPGEAPGGSSPTLASPRPNPFRSRVAIPLALAERGTVRVTVHDACGRTVAVLADGPMEAGSRTLEWSGTEPGGSPAPPGLYFVSLRFAGSTVVRRVTLAR